MGADGRRETHEVQEGKQAPCVCRWCLGVTRGDPDAPGGQREVRTDRAGREGPWLSSLTSPWQPRDSSTDQGSGTSVKPQRKDGESQPLDGIPRSGVLL